MLEWWRKRQQKRAKIAEQERRMAEALRKLDDEHAATTSVNDGEVERIEQQVAEANEAAEEAVALLEVELKHGTG